MEGIMTVREMIRELSQQPMDAPIMVAVVKYPEEFMLRVRDGAYSWADSTDVEVVPFEQDEITYQRGAVFLAVELADYDAQRHFAGG